MTAAMMTTFINAAKQRPDKVKEVLKGRLWSIMKLGCECES